LVSSIFNPIVFEKDIDAKSFAVHVKTLNEIAKRSKAGCYKHQEKVKKYTNGDAHDLQVIAAIDNIMLSIDSADYFFNRLASLRGDPVEAKSAFRNMSIFQTALPKQSVLSWKKTIRRKTIY
jgi:hypothetical protein